MAKKASKTGSILLLISAILTFVFSGVLLIISAIVALIPSVGDTAVPKWIIFGILIVITIFGILLGFFKIWVSNLMKDPEETQKAGIIALIVGIIFGPDILAIIGGIIALTESGK